ncbi:ribosomal protection-like ABC-F family protein [Paenactinomyces guangxiensis]|uniref:ABC-F family ATP-binding cassette domain-containing protein n=1 Tax=Paenactinomyces guangxiensis TaxID=1490290 RepID=A0A7W2A5X2_9BACL|nr:ABC-F family ATP-binding cassette domain-containing protein [Paenactinomyces guangxiensis]MBA4492766.1 ABC-F family ATP-binding cassette domain-containing protein [Paenactinomyces guangxiensis]MBH8590385.1 ABC-F family ATP-binding cassette domain-containing protein [Paenactinomyces guangxiensis]
MFVLEASHLKKWFADRLVFALDQFQIKTGEKIGVVGVNGAGKTTLLRVLAGEEPADEGQVVRRGTMEWIRQFDDSGYGGEPTLPPASTMSGGEWTRSKIISALAEKPALLLADEPTSHLDIESVQWLEKELYQYAGAVLLISHDRALLDAVCTKILEVENGQVRLYQGNYSDYRRQKEHQRERARFEYEQYIAEKKRLTEAAIEKSRQSKSVLKAPKRMSNSEARIPLNKLKGSSKEAKLEKQAKAIRSRIEQLEKKEKPAELPQVQFDLDVFQPIHGKNALQIEHLHKRFGKKNLFDSFSCTIPAGKKVALLGRNGAGKTTLLKMIAAQVPGVKIAPSAKIGYFDQKLDHLDEEKSILDNVKKDSPYSEMFIRTILARLLFPQETVYQPVRLLSGGEKTKVALAKVFLSDANLLLLDEPTNFLDLFTREQLEHVLKAYPGTILFATHDRQLMMQLVDHVLVLDKGKAVYFAGSYEEYTENQRRTRDLSEQECKQQLLQAENQLTELIGRLSMPQKGEDQEQLEARYQELLKEIKKLRR